MISAPQSAHFQLPLTVSRGANPLSESYAMLFLFNLRIKKSDLLNSKPLSSKRINPLFHPSLGFASLGYLITL